MKVTESCQTLCNPMDWSMDFSRPEYWSELSFPFPGKLPNPGIESRSPALQLDALPYELVQGVIICDVRENFSLLIGSIWLSRKEVKRLASLPFFTLCWFIVVIEPRPWPHKEK